jgi:hypothetical protein
MAVNIALFVMGRRDVIFSRVIFLNVSCINVSSFMATKCVTSSGMSTPRLDSIARQLHLASSNFDRDARSLASKLDAVKPSSKVLVWDKISSKQVVNESASPGIQLMDADISKRSKLREYCVSQCSEPSNRIPALMYDRAGNN